MIRSISFVIDKSFTDDILFLNIGEQKGVKQLLRGIISDP